MTLNQLQYFMSLANRLNFRAVAERYYITQPTLSRQIASMEEELHVKLFERSKHGVELTEAGKVLQERLPDVFQELMGVLHETQEVSAMGAKHICIGVQDDQAVSPQLMKAIANFRETDPAVHIRLERLPINDLYSGLLEDKIDLGNAIDLDGQYLKDMHYQILHEDKACLAMRSDIAANYGDYITSKEVDELVTRIPLGLISMEYIDTICEPIQAARTNLNINLPDDTATIESRFEALPLRVAAGMCVTIANETHIMSRDPDIRLVPVQDAKPYQKGLMYSEKSDNPALKRFLSTIV